MFYVSSIHVTLFSIVWHLDIWKFVVHGSVLTQLRPGTSEESISEELQYLQAALDRQQSVGHWTLRQILRQPRLRSLLLLVIALNVGQQLSGINAVSCIINHKHNIEQWVYAISI